MRYKIIDNFLTETECVDIIEAARPRLAISTTWNVAKAQSQVTDYRQSEQMYFNQRENEFIGSIEQRIADITRIPVENGEGFQVVHYNVGGYYKPHCDYFDPNWDGNTPVLNRGGQRIITFLIYLNNLPYPNGGETHFTRANLKIQPEAGKAIVWYNVDEDGKIDLSTDHEAMPVINGEKWVITKWLRDNTFT